MPARRAIFLLALGILALLIAASVYPRLNNSGRARSPGYSCSDRAGHTHA